MRSEPRLITRILFATDLSLCARHVEQHVALLSQAYGAAVDVVHVLEFYPGVYVAVEDHSETDGRLVEVVERLRAPGVSVTAHQETGIPSRQICEFAIEHHADLIMVGTHGRTGLDHMFLGSTAEQVLTMAPCPVFTVRAPKGLSPRHHHEPLAFKQVVVPVDFSDCSLKALEYGTFIAKDCDASLTLLHVLESVAYDDDGLWVRHDRVKDGIDSQLRSYARALQSVGVSVRQVIRAGVPADTILECGQSLDFDLIVMGTHGRRGISHAMWGSVAEAVLRRSTCPVLALNKFSYASGHRRIVQA
ncbi:MAG: universal stress protein [Nitrospira sp.]|nr:universal stress protein [Nitrospira sp.]